MTDIPCVYESGGGPNPPEGDYVTNGVVDGRTMITSSFQQPRDNGLGYHGAHDYIAIGSRNPVLRPPAGGWVELANRWNGIAGPGGSYGNYVLIRFDDRESGRWAHLLEFSERIEAYIASGYDPARLPYIEREEIVGLMGNTGNVWGTRADGSVGPPTSPADAVTGIHLHYEHRDAAGLLVDPSSRLTAPFADVSTPPEPDDTNPSPNSLEDYGAAGALLECRMLYRLTEFLHDYPVDYDVMVGALLSEARELVDGFRGRAPRDEALSLVGLLETVQANPLDYASVLAAVQRETAELLHLLQNDVP